MSAVNSAPCQNHVLVLLRQFSVTTITHSNLLRDTKVRKRHRLRRTLLIKDLAAVATVVLAIGEGKWCTTPQTNVRVDPLWRSLGIDHGRTDGCGVSRREVESCDA